eukprot:gnl/TRDRNA2_/TRDRNA2_140453_c0_seq2.p1 gnl/TRDRNA2_/TRDRNA2_140453_c0~~gnl/TRDRNA2_/TRDRNA2_140453_c0_seq2.p1  ORF type:complete len:292 (-),score=49.46 gnl/TRDRNA2_/TRDRNA2_140453_c0_seq2:226-1101(-)
MSGWAEEMAEECEYHRVRADRLSHMLEATESAFESACAQLEQAMCESTAERASEQATAARLAKELRQTQLERDALHKQVEELYLVAMPTPEARLRCDELQTSFRGSSPEAKSISRATSAAATSPAQRRSPRRGPVTPAPLVSARRRLVAVRAMSPLASSHSTAGNSSALPIQASGSSAHAVSQTPLGARSLTSLRQASVDRVSVDGCASPTNLRSLRSARTPDAAGNAGDSPASPASRGGGGRHLLFSAIEFFEKELGVARSDWEARLQAATQAAATPQADEAYHFAPDRM